MKSKYNIQHSVDNNHLDKVALEFAQGILEVEEMAIEVLQAINDLKEAHADGGVSTADPEAIADKWRDRVGRGLRLLDIFEEEMSKPRTKGDGDWALRIILRIVEDRGDPTTSEEERGDEKSTDRVE